MIVGIEEQLWMAAIICVGVLYAIMSAIFSKSKAPGK
jgi:hypothetical protein